MAKGSCLCGSVKFTVGGEISSMSHCHCSMCRKLHGSQFATYFNASELSYDQGEDSIQNYESSPGFHRTFCKHCGSVLPEKSNSSSTEGEYFIAAGLMDDDPGTRPDSHIFVESKASSYTITDALPQRTHYGDGDESRVVKTALPESKADAVTGGCQCGAVQFEYTGTPKILMNCHCTRCRKVKGAAHATNTFVAEEDFSWTHGEEGVQNYAHPPAVRFGNAFCTTCGSSLPRQSQAGGPFNVPVGSLNDAPGIEAKGHIYIGSKAPWFEVTDDKPQWNEMPE